MRRSIGVFLAKIVREIVTTLRIIFVIAFFAAAATGIWWPLTLAIIDNPVSLLWWGPLGFFATGLSFAFAVFVYDLVILVIGVPLTWLLNWLFLGEEEEA